MIFRLSTLLCFALLLLTGLSYAGSLSPGHILYSSPTIGDDVYMVGETVGVKGKVIGDLIMLGKTISCTGQVAADLLALGLEVEAGGNINDDIRVLGLLTEFQGNVGDDAILLGLKVHTGPNSRIGHTAIILAGESSIDGLVQGDLILTGYHCVLGGEVKGNVTASAVKLQLLPTAHIAGDLVYTSQEPVVIPPGAVVEGQIIHNKPPASTHSFSEQHSNKWTRVVIMLIWDASLMLVGSLLLLLVPQTISISSRLMAAKPWLACLYGFLWLVGAPVAASIGAMTIIGLPIAFAIIFIYLSSLYLSALPVALWIGQKIFRTQDKPYLAMLLGLSLISLLRSLPYVGFVFGTISLTVGLGSLALSFLKKHDL